MQPPQQFGQPYPQQQFGQPYPQQQQIGTQPYGVMQQQSIPPPHVQPPSQQNVTAPQDGANPPQEHHTLNQTVGHAHAGTASVTGPPPTYTLPTPNTGVEHANDTGGGFRTSSTSQVVANNNNPADAHRETDINNSTD